MKLDKPAFVAFVTTLSLICATIPCAAMGRNLAKFSPTPHSYSRLATDEQTLAADMEKLRSHLRHGADESQIALERARIHRDWENIVAERGSKPAELSSRLTTFRSFWRFSSPRHIKRSEA